MARTACTWSLVLEVVLANGPMGTATAQGAKKNKHLSTTVSAHGLKKQGEKRLTWKNFSQNNYFSPQELYVQEA